MNIFYMLLKFQFKENKKMSGIVNAFEEFGETSKIKNVIIDWSRKNNEIMLYVYCIEKDINVLNEKNRLLNLCCKHGVSWGGTWEVPPKLTQILSVRPNYTSTFIFTFKKKKTDSFFSLH